MWGREQICNEEGLNSAFQSMLLILVGWTNQACLEKNNPIFAFSKFCRKPFLLCYRKTFLLCFIIQNVNVGMLKRKKEVVKPFLTTLLSIIFLLHDRLSLFQVDLYMSTSLHAIRAYGRLAKAASDTVIHVLQF